MRRRTPVTIALLAAVAAAAPSAAQARPADALRLRASGWDVAWPTGAAQADFPAGATVELIVRPRAERPPAQRAVRVALVRVDADGNPVRTVATRTLRRGTFRARLARAGGVRYLLSVKAGRRVYRSWLTTTAPPAPSRDGAPAPTVPPPAFPQPPAPPQPSVQPPCSGLPTTGGSAVIELDRTTVTAGERIAVLLRNTGPTCMYGGGSGAGIERLVEGAWQPGEPYVDTLELRYFEPGRTYGVSVQVPDVPGRYRVLKSVALGSSGGPWQQFTAEFDVVAPPAP